MPDTHNAVGFSAALQQQIQLLDLLSQSEHQLQHAVMHKDWQSLETTIARLYELSNQVYKCEQVRHREFTALRESMGLPETARFSALLADLSAEERLEIASLYRRLKISVLRVQTLTEGLDSYLNSTVQTMQQIVQELFPSTRGGVYSKDGNLNGTQPPAMVINQHL